MQGLRSRAQLERCSLLQGAVFDRTPSSHTVKLGTSLLEGRHALLHLPADLPTAAALAGLLPASGGAMTGGLRGAIFRPWHLLLNGRNH